MLASWPRAEGCEQQSRTEKRKRNRGDVTAVDAVLGRQLGNHASDPKSEHHHKRGRYERRSEQELDYRGKGERNCARRAMGHLPTIDLPASEANPPPSLDIAPGRTSPSDPRDQAVAAPSQKPIRPLESDTATDEARHAPRLCSRRWRIRCATTAPGTSSTRTPT